MKTIPPPPVDRIDTLDRFVIKTYISGNDRVFRNTKDAKGHAPNNPKMKLWYDDKNFK